MRLEGKVAIVTGAASGMGASTARIFAREGCKVVIADMLDGEGRKIAAEITAANGAAAFHRLDVTDEANWKAVLASLSLAAKDGSNLVPPIVAAVDAFATIGEISDALREVFGEFTETATV